PRSSRMQALARGAGRRGSRVVQVRRPAAVTRASAAAWAAEREANGPRARPAGSAGPLRTTDRRGCGSSVSRSQGRRSGARERRLYRGEYWAIARSSRTEASDAVAQGTVRTEAARSTISPIRERFSDAVK